MKQSVATARAVCTDALSLPFADATFDLVLMRDVLHHINWDRDGLIREALRVFQPQGTVVIFDSNGKTIRSLVHQLFYKAERGLIDLTPRTLSALGKRHGICRLENVEASFLIRALSFFFGWSDGPKRLMLHPLYAAAGLWERVVATVLPKRKWIYMMLVLRRRGSSAEAMPQQAGRHT